MLSVLYFGKIISTSLMRNRLYGEMGQRQWTGNNHCSTSFSKGCQSLDTLTSALKRKVTDLRSLKKVDSTEANA